MPTQPFVVDRFGGLDIFNDPQEVGAASAIDMLNVDLDQRGRVRARDGSTALTAAASSQHNSAMTYTNAGGTERVVALVGVNTVTPYLLSNGTAGTTQAATPTSNNAFARFGDPSNIRLYMAAGTLYRYDGSVWTTVTAPISPTLAAVTANDNRLAICDGTTIHWSDAGAPETFGSSNKIQLWPGDGENVTGLVRWRDYLFAFKQTRFAVFTSTGLQSDGSPVFNYRSMDAGHGCYAVGQAVAGDEGVYFADASGIYLTTGDTPQYISQPLEPWLRTGSHGSLPTFSLSGSFLVYHNRRLYVTYVNGANAVTLIFDPTLNAWMVWKLGVDVMCSVPSSSSFRGLYFGDFTSKKIAKLDSTVSTDQGSAVSWQYTSGAYDMGEPANVKITRESRAWGTGTATLQIATDFASFDTGSSLTLGTDPTIADAWQLIDREGTLWQHKLSGTAAGNVSRLAHYISFVKPVGLQ